MLPEPFRLPSTILFSFGILLFSGCEPTRESERTFDTVEASVDFAKTRESGGSRIDYDPKTGENIVTYHEFQPSGLGTDLSRDLAGIPATEKPDAGWLAVRAGFGFVGKGAKATQGGGKLSLNYLEVPIQGIYRYPLAKGTEASGNAFLVSDHISLTAWVEKQRAAGSRKTRSATAVTMPGTNVLMPASPSRWATS